MTERDEQSGDEENIQLFQGLTDEQRREIRKSQRLLRKEIPDLDVDEARQRNNEIHKNVRYIRESVLDAENLDEIAKKATNKVDQMIQVSQSCLSCWSPGWLWLVSIVSCGCHLIRVVLVD
jgi:uncharacterized protein YigA (DUF484 family)